VSIVPGTTPAVAKCEVETAFGAVVGGC
jgi:hypothetical protein